MIELEGIEKGILNYNKSSKDSLIENLLPQDYKMLLWHINTKCNFKCKYCGYHLTPEEHFCYDAIVIRRALKKLSDKLVIFISSYGEPFLYPNFLEIVNLLSKDNILSINTNLSHQLVYQLPENINVLNIMAIHAAFHVEEIERHYGEKGIFEFIKKVAFLEEKGFNVVVSYLAYPSLFNRIVKDIQILRDGGVNKIMAKPFIGIYKNKQYPHSYSNNEWMILKKLSTSNNDVDFLDLPESFSNRLCMAGSKSFFLNHKGDIHKCMSSKAPLGNLFSQKKISFLRNRTCNFKEYHCKFECVMNSKNLQYGFIKRLFSFRHK